MLTTMTVKECNKCEHKDNYMFGLTPHIQKTERRVKDKPSMGVWINF